MRDYESIFWDYYNIQCGGEGKREEDKIKVIISKKIVDLTKENDELKQKLENYE